ncbi:MAG: alkaline phosphatase family protein [Planctomycetota bacterium]
MANQKVLVIGWDSADWKIVNDLIDRGCMPNLKSLIENGVMGNISTLHPILSPMLWTSIATGKRPYKHGIYGFSEPTPDGLNIQPTTILSRKTKAIWNILNQSGKRSVVVGWWPSHPAEPINGVMVSDYFHRGITHPDKPWPIRQGTVSPEEMQDELAALRFHPSEFTEEEVTSFLPKAYMIDQEVDQRLHLCAKTMAECTTIHSAATHLLETEEWDFGAVYFDSIDHFSHLFMKYHPPQQKHVSDKDFEIFQHAVESSYVYHDMMLRAYMQLAGPDATIIVLSDHGFHSDHLRPTLLPNEPAGPAAEHRDQGILVMKGPGIRKDHLIHGAGLLDVAPTLLQIFGLPVGEDMDGRVLTDIFETPVEIESIPSWDDVAGDCGTHPEERKLDPFEAEESLQQLVDLGYIEAPKGDMRETIQSTINELNFNLSRAFLDGGRTLDALPLLHELFCNNPSEYRYGIQLAMCLKKLNRLDELEQLVELLNDRRFEDSKTAIEGLSHFKEVGQIRMAERRKEKEEKAKENGETIGDDANEDPIEFVDKAQARQDALALFSKDEWKQINNLRSVATINQYAIEFLKGYVKVARGDYTSAIENLKKSIEAEPGKPSLYIQIGEALLESGELEEAEAAFKKGSEIDPLNASLLLGRARCALNRESYEEAVELCLNAVGEQYHFPMAHYFLAIAFRRSGRTQKAVQALEISIEQNPNNVGALELLSHIYKVDLEDVESAAEYQELARIAGEVTQEQSDMVESYPIPTLDELPENSMLKDRLKLPEKGEAAMKRVPGLGVIANNQVAVRNPDQPFVTVVTGLPRSGTSMMMQMLAAGGLPLLIDGNRTADEDNPHGYQEHDKVKQLAVENKWIEEGTGKAVKVIVQLLEYLPIHLNYRFITMNRDIDEIVRSQQTMLTRNDASGAGLESDKLKSIFSRQLKRASEIAAEAKIEVLDISFAGTIADARGTAEQLCSFLGMDLNVDAMIEAVDGKLYRQKKTTSDQ